MRKRKKGARYWKSEEEDTCAECGKRKETLEHMLRECKENLRDCRNLTRILEDSGEGADWMRRVLNNRQSRDEANQRNEQK